jgi:UDP-glucuronate 4-epimerase
MSTFVITGSAGFIGFHLSLRLLNEGHRIISIDNINDYYDVNLKKSRLAKLQEFKSFNFVFGDISDRNLIEQVFGQIKPEFVIHLAAQVGVRYSIENPYPYAETNLMGFLNILEACRNHQVKHLIFASSSSVYGNNNKIPFSTKDSVDKPANFYGATKRANELMAYSYSHLFGIPTTGLRFFTAYGPWGRPDMAYYIFTKQITMGQPFTLFNKGLMQRDFTYVDDIVEGIIRLIEIPPENNPVPYRLLNIGNNSPVLIKDMIVILENLTGKKAVIKEAPMQHGEMLNTYADIDDFVQLTGYKPQTNIAEGLKKFVDWFQSYHTK